MSPTDPARIPVAIRDAVELWARRGGRHARIGWNHAMRCAVIDIDLSPHDPRLKEWKEGRLRFEPKESIPLHYQPKAGAPFCAIDLEQLGPSGLTEMLEKADTWSGRGEYTSMREAVQAVERYNENLREQMRKAALENSRARSLDHRRQVFDLPLVSVLDNIGEANGRERTEA